MSKFYGGGGVEGHATLRRLESAEPGSHLARHPTPPGSTHRIVPASTPYTREEVAFADAYAREQMQDGLTPEAG